ncbi:MAG: DUF2169 domain-containing protein [Fibrobacteres bacterium]|nr:DUF2169 domain-containing protein [Fibrobacterota bacterium]
MKWLTRMIPGHMPDGSPVVSVLAKASWSLLPDDLPLQDDPVDWVEADVHWDTNNPATEATQFENELVPWKPCTDVIVIGNAWAPRGKQGKYFDAGIQIGAFRKVVRVFGNRKIVPKTFGFEFSEPELFETMPMHFGKAYGGRFLSSKTQAEMVYPRNPVGTGFLVDPTLEEIFKVRLPNLENPAQVLTPENLVLKSLDQWTNMPMPWALGYTNRNFHPRVTYAGLPPDLAPGAEISRLQTRAESEGMSGNSPTPVMNAEFHCGAPDGLKLPYLKGDEDVALGYMDPDHPIFKFPLPGKRPAVWMDVGMGREWMDTVLQSVIITKGNNQLSMVWRGSCRYDGPESMAEWTKFAIGAED